MYMHIEEERTDSQAPVGLGWVGSKQIGWVELGQIGSGRDPVELGWVVENLATARQFLVIGEKIFIYLNKLIK